MIRSAKYPIRAAAKMSGVSIDTLRAWERRHGAVHPVRDERGRMYTDDDVQRLRLLRDAVAHGQSIGRIAHLDEDELRALAARATPEAPNAAGADPRGAPRPRPGIDIADMLDAIERFDSVHVEAELARAAALLAPMELLRQVLVPLLETIGNRWRVGAAGIAHEHLLSAVVRNVLGSLLRAHNRQHGPVRLVFATPSGERHELGTLGAAILAASGGAEAIYLGPCLPGADVVALAQTAEADVVVLGVTATPDVRAEVSRTVHDIACDMPRDVEIWLGGPAASGLGATLPRHAVVLSSYDALAEQLTRIGARA